MTLKQIGLYLLATLGTLYTNTTLEKTIVLLHTFVLTFQLCASILDPVECTCEILVGFHYFIALLIVFVLSNRIYQCFLHFFTVFQLMFELLHLLFHLLFLFLKLIFTLGQCVVVRNLFFH